PRWRGVVAGGVVPDRRPRAVVAGAVEGLDLDADVGARLDPAPGVGGGGDPAGRGGLVVEALLVRERIAGREPADLGQADVGVADLVARHVVGGGRGGGEGVDVVLQPRDLVGR